ncbi:transcriptional activator FtrB [Rubripirellula tenax]|uniref:Transcriptional activator FtrB n=1 Tax=Rubripirellula tenax TaxID=2528015 RepID=A0A5C6ESI5_9BACT|nr:cyclic nucleotide-binding domain-containing protein [Rubripirellula tenax]TWU50546.1 transcriptional activator FtrB [Rubripirellula tenax]
MKPDDTDPLNSIGIGDGLCGTDRTRLRRLAVTVDCDAADTIFREGERHPFVYWVVEGQVSLEMATSGTNMQPLITLATGDLLAWSALLTNRRMSATANTTEPTRLLRFQTDELLALCSVNHEIGYHVMQHIAAQLAQRLLATRLQMLDLFRHPTTTSAEPIQ